MNLPMDLAHRIPAVIYQFLVTADGEWQFVFLNRAIIGMGKSSKEIAEQLGLALATVSAHRRNIKKKLRGKTAIDVTRFALLNYTRSGGEM